MKAWISSREVAAQNLKYVDDRRKGLITSTKTKFDKFNNALMGGIEDNNIVTISAMSGAGKSTLAKSIRDSLPILNTNRRIKQLLFNYELIAHQQLGRSVSTKFKKSLHDLYSVNEYLTDEEFERLKPYYDELANRGVYFVEKPMTPTQMYQTMCDFYEQECRSGNFTMIVEIDHLILALGEPKHNTNTDKVEELMNYCIRLKKEIASDGGKCIIIAISQMNRNIQNKERIADKAQHTPLTSDLFAASAIEFASDVIVFLHQPSKLGIEKYTTAQLPTKMLSTLSPYPLAIPYFELVKNRSGVPNLTFPLINKLSHFDFDEMPKEVFEELYRQMRDEGNTEPMFPTHLNYLL